MTLNSSNHVRQLPRYPTETRAFSVSTCGRTAKAILPSENTRPGFSSNFMCVAIDQVAMGQNDLPKVPL
jgi:hypothetical protein